MSICFVSSDICSLHVEEGHPDDDESDINFFPSAARHRKKKLQPSFFWPKILFSLDLKRIKCAAFQYLSNDISHVVMARTWRVQSLNPINFCLGLAILATRCFFCDFYIAMHLLCKRALRKGD